MKRLIVRNQFKNKMTPWIELYPVASLEESYEVVKEETLEYGLKFTLNVVETNQFIFITIVFL